jgi:tetratricopeptide (TPR) repeat protein
MPGVSQGEQAYSLLEPAGPGAGIVPDGGHLFVRARPTGIGWIGLVWLAGLAVCGAWFALSRHLLRRVVARARPMGGSWQAILESLSIDLDVRREVRLLKSPDLGTAMTAGVRKPVIILPASAESWSKTRRRLVLSHELAHVKRWDSLIEILGFAASALHWFNPLAWLALNRLRIERERDCDNAVINSGAKPSDYAALLMEIATDMHRRSRPMWQIATVRESSNLKDRLLCILDPKMDRRNGSPGSVFTIGLLVAALAIPLSGSRVWKSPVVEVAGGDDDLKEEQVLKKEKQKAARELEVKAKEEELKKKEQTKRAQAKSKTEKLMNVREKLESSIKDDKTRGTSAARVIGLSAYDGGTAAAARTYEKLRSESGGYYFDEVELNRVGYMLLKLGKADEATAVFQMNVDMYPESWNVYDSLGEAYLEKGDLARATDLYEKSLELNPENDNGKKMLTVIKMKMN